MHTCQGTIKTARRGTYQAARQADKRDKEVIFKNCPPLTDFIS